MTDTLARAELLVLELPYRSAITFRSSQGSGGTYVILRLTTRDGASGAAEVTGIANVPDSDPAVLAAQFERFFRPLLEGADPLDGDALLAALARIRGASIAKALIDTALWDLRGNMLGQPAWKMLGGAAPEPVPVTAILFGDTPEAMLADAEQAVERGIRTLKVKLWKHSLDDVYLVRDMRRAVGDGVLIYADANYAYSEAEALSLLPRLAEYGVTMIEDPCRLSAERLAVLSGSLPLTVLSEIPIDSPADAERFIEHEAAGALSLHVRRTGITDTAKMAALCERAGIPAILGTDLESDFGVPARLHLHAAIASLRAWPAEVQFFERLDGSVLASPLSVVDGAVRIPDGPGFGAALDEAQLKRYAR